MAIALSPSTQFAEFSADVVSGLGRKGQKELSSKYLYDDVGSALFDVICLLPEYGLSRAGLRGLQQHSDEIIRHIADPLVVAELGSGSGNKTRWLLEVLARRQSVTYFPIDISESALFRCQQELKPLQNVHVRDYTGLYLDGLQYVASQRAADQKLLVLFLGSTIGNFARKEGEQFLTEIRAHLRLGDMLLLATDLEKPMDVLTQAYADPTGVTAAFNKNVLARINRELDGNFDLDRFVHVARYDKEERRIEMHLMSTVCQEIHIAKAGFQFSMNAGETIWTESSHKFNPEEVIGMGQRCGFGIVGQWFDTEWPFAHHLFSAV